MLVNTRSFVGAIFLIFCSAVKVSAEEMIIHIGQNTPAGGLNPVLAVGTSESQIHRSVFETLVKLRPGGGLMPGLAKEWEISDDGLQLDFYIFEDARWSDGVRITPETVVQSFRFSQALETSNPWLPSSDFSVNEIKEEGRAGVRFLLGQPDLFFLDKLTQPYSAILPLHLANDLDFTESISYSKWESLPYSGPYIIAGLSDNGIMLRPNSEYHSPERVRNDGVNIRYVDELTVSDLAEFQSGGLHFTRSNLGKDAEDVIGNFKEYAKFYGSPFITFIQFNVSSPSLSDPEIRRALSLAAGVNGFEALTSSSSLSSMDTFIPEHVNRNYERAIAPWSLISNSLRLKLAQSIMLEKGYSEESPLKIDFAVDAREPNIQIGNLLRAAWSKIGVEAEIAFRDWPDHVQAVLEHNYDAARAGWNYDYDHPISLLELFETHNVYNFGGTSNEEYDRLISALRSAPNAQASNEASLAAQRLIFDNYWAIPLFTARHFVLENPNLRGTEPTFESHRYYERFFLQD